MTFPKARLAVSLCLFLAWLGFLGYLVYERYSIVLSRPQFAVAQAILLAEIRDDNSSVQIKEIVWVADKKYRDQLSQRPELRLPEVLSCGKAQGFVGAGVYVIPIAQHDGFFEIAPIHTPGFQRPFSHAGLFIKNGGKNTEAVLAHLLQYAKAKPQHAEGLADALVVPVVQCLFARVFSQEEPTNRMRGIDLPRRLPLADARRLRDELTKLGADVQLTRVEELRIYPDTSQTRIQVAEFVAAKEK